MYVCMYVCMYDTASSLPPFRLAVLPVLLIVGASQLSARVLLSIVHTVTSQRCLNMLVVLSLATVLFSLLH